ncbi:MAG: ABC transporter ATP-binding protein [Spirochaetales bacterium]|nr:ABC transporter ATP-binding protein [Spirochaetales bacterium]
MKNAIEIRKLTKDYKDIRAVDNLDLEIHEGELFALLGVNGAGKTTTIKMLCCITQPTSGDALLNGKSIASEADAVKKIIAVSPQETAVAPNLSVEENLKLMCGVHGFDRQRAEKRTNEMIEEFKLDRIRKKKASKLSGGWQRRLSIAMALISEPQILFLDEPTLGLDVIARSELWDSIRELKGKMTIILTTHYMEEAEELSDRIGVMKDGHILAVGTAAELKKHTGEEKFENAFIKLVKEGGAR